MKQDLEEILSKPIKYYIHRLIEKYGELDLSKPILLFGAGQMGDIYYKNCKKNDISILGIFDNDIAKHSKVFAKNFKVKTPRDLDTFSRDTQIIVTSIFDEEIIKQLKKLGFSKVWSHAFATTVFPQVFYNPYWLNNIEKIIKNKESVFESYSLFTDPLSRKTFMAILEYRLRLEKNNLTKLKQTIKHEYFDKKIVKASNDEVFVDGGAYNGDTTKKFIKISKGKFKNIIAFEPDSNLFNKLEQYVYKLNDKRIVVYPYGLGKKNSTMKFTNDGTLGSRLSETGGRLVKIVNLDNYLKLKPTFIKLDIEGSELDALEGAKKIISKFHPKITLSLYHKTEDLWEIPIYLKKLCPDYRFYMRHYSPFLYDTICYAI